MLVFLTPAGASAGDATDHAASREVVEFSADTVQQIPNREAVQGKFYVSKEKIRRETGTGDMRRITIVDSGNRKTIHLNPARKEYMEIPWPPKSANRPHPRIRQPLPGDPDHPCANPMQLKCKILSREEKIGDRKTEKWEIVRVAQASNRNGQANPRTDSQAMNPQTINPPTMHFLVWVDRKLGANVREERFINGNLQGSSEFRAIKEGTQPETLFRIPAGYQRIEIPRHSPGGQMGGPTGGNM